MKRPIPGKKLHPIQASMGRKKKQGAETLLRLDEVD